MESKENNKTLYLKYRPNTLDEIIGNEDIVAVLKSQLSGNQPVSKSILFHGPTGCGKTTLGRIIANELGAKGSDLREIDSADFRGIDTIRDIRKQSAYKPLESPCRVWILDECFAKGTRIKMTNETEKSIESIEIGDRVQNLYKGGTVTRTFQNIVQLNRVVKITFSNGNKIICSKEHLFLTSSGWKKAEDLKKDLILSPCYNIMLNKDSRQGDKTNEKNKMESLSQVQKIVSEKSNSILQQNMRQSSHSKAHPLGNSNMPNLPTEFRSQMVQSKTNLFQNMWKQISRAKKNRFNQRRRNTEKIITNNVKHEKKQSREIQAVMQNQFRAYEENQSNEQPEKHRKGQSYEKSQWNLEYLVGRKRRQWKIDHSSDNISLFPWLGNRICNLYRTSFLRWFWFPYKLQSRYSKPSLKISSGSGWSGTQFEKREAIRQEKRREISFVGVESVESYQRGSNDKSFSGIIEDKERNQGYIIFYDLEIDSHPSYVANGMLVHNCHRLTGDAMSALLKALEDTPSHVYYILCTTDPQKLLPTIRGRCSQFQVKPLTEREMKILLRRVVKAENESISKEVYEQIVQDSLGHPRNALQILAQVLAVEEGKRLQIAKKTAEMQSKTIELCRALINGEPWKKVSNILKGLKDEEPEQIRRAVLGYCQAVLLGSELQNNGVAGIMEEMEDDLFSSGFPGLVLRCYSILYSEDDLPF